jgi:hypothetical protein
VCRSLPYEGIIRFRYCSKLFQIKPQYKEIICKRFWTFGETHFETDQSWYSIHAYQPTRNWSCYATVLLSTKYSSAVLYILFYIIRNPSCGSRTANDSIHLFVQDVSVRPWRKLQSQIRLLSCSFFNTSASLPRSIKPG